MLENQIFFHYLDTGRMFKYIQLKKNIVCDEIDMFYLLKSSDI